MKRKQARQGDVLLIPVASIPETAVELQPEPDRPIILAYGEATGHAHSIFGRAKMFRDDGAGSSGAAFVLCEKGAVLAHGTPTDAVTIPRDPDHGPIGLEGPYRVQRQVEFPRAEPERRVAD